MNFWVCFRRILKQRICTMINSYPILHCYWQEVIPQSAWLKFSQFFKFQFTFSIIVIALIRFYTPLYLINSLKNYTIVYPFPPHSLINILFIVQFPLYNEQNSEAFITIFVLQTQNYSFENSTPKILTVFAIINYFIFFAKYRNVSFKLLKK